MHNPEKFGRERERLRSEIDANRTPEQRLEAEQVRAVRASYDALSNGKKKEQGELQVFNAFAAVASEAHIDPSSGFNANFPEPDIRCTVAGDRHYFELGEITDQSVAKSLADAIKHDLPKGSAFSQDRPFAHIIEKKCRKSYRANGAPVDLLLYYRTQAPPPLSLLGELLKNNASTLEALVVGGRFQRVWIFDFLKRHVLWSDQPTPGH